VLSKAGEDFVIIIGKDKWEKMSDEDRRCLVDHELCHAGVKVSKGVSEWVLRRHVIEDFPENLARFESRRKRLGELIAEPPNPVIMAERKRRRLIKSDQVKEITSKGSGVELSLFSEQGM
jgi:hypothetical protein